MPDSVKTPFVRHIIREVKHSYSHRLWFTFLIFDLLIFIDREAREIMYLVASVRPSVRPSVCPSVRLYVRALLFEPFVCRLIAWRSHYQSKMFVCVSTNRADAVDRLLIGGTLEGFFCFFLFGKYTSINNGYR